MRFVAAANVMRRHLTPGERADAAATIETMTPGNQPKDAPVHVSRAEAAEMFGVSERAVADAKAVAESDDEELKAKVKAGEVSRKKAAGGIRKKRKEAKAKERKAQPAPTPRSSSANITYLPANGMTITVEQWKRATPEQHRNPTFAGFLR